MISLNIDGQSGKTGNYRMLIEYHKEDGIGFTILGGDNDDQIDFSIDCEEWDLLKDFIDSNQKLTQELPTGRFGCY